MTRIWLMILAVIEAALGLFLLVAAAILTFSHPAGMAQVLLPALPVVALLLIAGAAIFLRRPWSYWLHIGAILALGVLLMFSAGAFVGGAELAVWLPVGAIVVALTVVFLLPPVRRYFGVTAN